MRLSENDVEALKALAKAHGGSISDALRAVLAGAAVPMAGIPLEILKLDAELVRLDSQAKRDAYLEVGGRELAQLRDEGIANLRRELEALNRAAQDQSNPYRDAARKRVETLAATLERLELLRTQALTVAEQKAAELRKKADLDPLVGVSGGALADALEDFLKAQREYEAVTQIYRFLPERQGEVAVAADRLSQAREKLEKLLALYTEALALRQRRKEERQAQQQAEQEAAKEALRPAAERVFALYEELIRTLREILSDWAKHPKLAEAVRLAGQLNEARDEFYTFLGKASEKDRYGNPSRAVQELINALRAKHMPDPLELNVSLKTLRWFVQPELGFDAHGMPTVPKPGDDGGRFERLGR